MAANKNQAWYLILGALFVAGAGVLFYTQQKPARDHAAALSAAIDHLDQQGNLLYVKRNDRDFQLFEDKSKPIVGLSLWQDELSDEDWRRIDLLTQLEFLDVGVVTIRDDDLRHLASKERMRTLKLSGREISGAGLFAVNEQLENLDVSGCEINIHGLTAIGGFRQLRELNLSHSGLTDLPNGSLSGISTELLNLSFCELDESSFRELARMSTVETLYASNVEVSKGGGHELAKMKGLRRLDLLGTRISHDDLCALQASTSLERIRIDAFDADPEVISSLGRIPTLTEIVIGRPRAHASTDPTETIEWRMKNGEPFLILVPENRRDAVLKAIQDLIAKRPLMEFTDGKKWDDRPGLPGQGIWDQPPEGMERVDQGDGTGVF